MRHLLLMLLHLLSKLGKLLRPGGAKSLVAENILLKQQLLILRRSRRRAPNLRFRVTAPSSSSPRTGPGSRELINNCSYRVNCSLEVCISREDFHRLVSISESVGDLKNEEVML